MKLIVGLGNPGPKYRNTRHNVGFVVLDRLAEVLGTAFDRQKYKGLVAEATCEGKKVRLLKPLTYMNLSGDSVAMAARYSASAPGDLLVLCDDVDLPLGTLRIRAGGSAGTHNGMRSVLERLGTKDVPRLRMGIGQDIDGGGGGLTNHVLGKFKPQERKVVDEMVDGATRAAIRCIEAGITATMNEFNRA